MVHFGTVLGPNRDLVPQKLTPIISLKILATYSPAQVQGQSVEDYMVQAQDRTKKCEGQIGVGGFQHVERTASA